MKSNYPPDMDLCKEPVEREEFRMGRPTTYLSFKILRILWEKRDRYLSATEIKRRAIIGNNGEVNGILQGLKDLDFVTESGSEPGHYKYNLHSRNANCQAGFEVFLWEVEAGKRPNFDDRLDYSPNYRSRAINGTRI